MYIFTRHMQNTCANVCIFSCIHFTVHGEFFASSLQCEYRVPDAWTSYTHANIPCAD